MSVQSGRYTAAGSPRIAEGWTLDRLTPPSRLFGANGLRSGPDGRIYVAQVSGSQMPQAGDAMIYRVRPHRTDPDRCIFEILSSRTYPAALTPPRATVQKVTDLSDPEQLRLIPRQDLGYIPRMRRGLHSRGCKQIWLANYYEQIILHMHQELDRYLLAGP